MGRGRVRGERDIMTRKAIVVLIFFHVKLSQEEQSSSIELSVLHGFKLCQAC